MDGLLIPIYQIKVTLDTAAACKRDCPHLYKYQIDYGMQRPASYSVIASRRALPAADAQPCLASGNQHLAVLFIKFAD